MPFSFTDYLNSGRSIDLDKTEIDNKKIEKEKELQAYLADRNTVKMQILDISRQIKELELRKSTLTQAITMSNYNIQRVKSEMEVLKTQYWQSLN